MFSRRTWIAVIVGSAIIASAGIPANANMDQADPVTPACPSPWSGQRLRFVGDPSPATENAALAVAQLVAMNPSLFAAVEYCADYSGVRVYTADSTGRARNLVAAVRHHNPGVKIWTFQRRWSKADVLAAAGVESERAGDEVTLISPNPVAGEVVVSRREGTPLRRASTTPSGVPVREQLGDYFETNAGRQADVSPFTAGSKIIDTAPHPSEPNVSIVFSCSLGPRVKIDGVYRTLTAGHCSRSNYYSPAGGRVGATLTTTWPGSALKYGDWKVLYGGSYSGSVWSGGIYSATRLAPWGIDWNDLPYGQKLCHSGAASGQPCRFQAELNHQVVSYKDEQTGAVTRAGRITFLSSSGGLCNGWIKGDSGGAVYYNHGGDRMAYTGLVSGLDPGSCTYLMAEIGGVRAWNASATW